MRVAVSLAISLVLLPVSRADRPVEKRQSLPLDTSSFNVVSELSSLSQLFSSAGVTLSSFPSTSLGAFTGPYVSDIASSVSEFYRTRTTNPTGTSQPQPTFVSASLVPTSGGPSVTSGGIITPSPASTTSVQGAAATTTAQANTLRAASVLFVAITPSVIVAMLSF